MGRVDIVLEDLRKQVDALEEHGRARQRETQKLAARRDELKTLNRNLASSLKPQSQLTKT
jgi:cell division protein FtsB